MRKKIIVVAAVLVAAMMSGGNKVLAANGWEEELKLVTVGASSQVMSSVSLSLSSGTIQTDLDAANAATNPDEAGKVLSQTATITVGNTDGYTVYVSGNANLTGRNNTSHKIPSVGSNKTLGNMSNEWGYYGVLGDSEANFNPSTSFKAMTASQQSVGTGGATSSSITKKLTLFYGARVNNSAAADFYENTITLSVVAQPGTITVPITTMQDFDKTACGKLKTHETLQLTDTRDSKKYWITKMLDGNCWMSQNLALDLSTSKALTSADSDVTSSWTSGRDTVNISTSNPLSSSNTSTSNTETYSWNLGNYVIINPIAATECTSNSTGLSACSGQFTAVGSRTPSSDPSFYKTNGATYTATEYDAHYLAGNYYQWNAATAGTGGTITNANATGSICPKNWKLPSSGNNTTKGTFGYMLTQYGVQSKPNVAAGAVASPVNSNNYDVALSPLFFVRGGDVYPYGQKLDYAGQGGYYWSSKAYSRTDLAYSLSLGSSSVSPSNSYNGRYGGFSLRCLIPMS